MRLPREAAVLSILCCQALVGCARSDPASPQAVTAEYVRQMLRQSLRDKANSDTRFFLGTGSKIALGLGGEKPWMPLFPVTYAREKLICQGSVVIPPLLAILADSSEKPDMILTAARALVYFDDPRILEAYMVAAEQGRLSVDECADLIRFHTPYCPEHPEVWVGSHPTYEELCLAGLDWYVTQALVDHPGYRAADFPSTVAMRWLNRIYDRDLDEWLAEKAPDALRYRNACLAKGYDPVVAFDYLDPRVGFFDEAIFHGMFPHKSDRAAFRRLCRLVFPDPLDAADRAQVPAGWNERLAEWYRANRVNLVYDYARHRFVVRGAATTEPAARSTGATSG